MEKIGNLMNLKVTVENKTVVRVLLIIVGFVFAGWLIFQIRSALFLIAIAFFLAVAINPLVSFLARKMPHGSRGLATAIAYLTTLALLFILFYSLVPPLIAQIKEFIQDLPNFVAGLATDNHPIARLARRYDLVDSFAESQKQLTERLKGAGGPIFTVLRRTSGSLLSGLTVLVLTFFMLVEGPTILERFWQAQPASKRKHRKEILQQMYRVYTSYVNGQLLVALLAGLSTYVVLRIVGIPFAGSLAAIVGVFGLIPLIGATMGATIVVLAALAQSLTAGLIVLIFFLAYQQIENNVFQPIVQSKTVKLSPLLILIAVITGATLAGILGAVIAIPTAGSIRVLVIDYVNNHRTIREA